MAGFLCLHSDLAYLGAGGGEGRELELWKGMDEVLARFSLDRISLLFEKSR